MLLELIVLCWMVCLDLQNCFSVKILYYMSPFSRWFQPSFPLFFDISLGLLPLVFWSGYGDAKICSEFVSVWIMGIVQFVWGFLCDLILIAVP